VPSEDPALPPWITAGPHGLVVAVKAVPRSTRTGAAGVQDGAVRIRIAAAPHRGQSNAALCAYLAGAAGVRPGAVRVRRGSSGARKLVEVDGDAAVLGPRLAAALAAEPGMAP
jgi:uncharacterized protein YggU (UPF0235/DUF167 family)